MRFAGLATALGVDSIAVAFGAGTREAAIAKAGELLVASGRCLPEYAEEMLAALEKHGPYMVLVPGIALVHGRPSVAVLETGLSLVTLHPGVIFGHAKHDPVRLVIGLAATDNQSHIGLMSELARLLSDGESVNCLLNASRVGQVRELFA